MEHRILIAGSGGQGILFFGRVLACAAMREGREVTWFPSYGAEMRGGTANCTVIISDAMIGSPAVRHPDILVVMNDASYQRFVDRLFPGGLLLHDSALTPPVTRRSDVRTSTAPAGQIAASLGQPHLANTALLGALTAETGIVEADTVLRCLDESTPAHRRELLMLNRDIFLRAYRQQPPVLYAEQRKVPEGQQMSADAR